LLQGAVTKVVACSAGLGAFAIAVVAGLAADNPADEILSRAIICMAAMYFIGLGLGAVVERAVHERALQHIRDNPLPGAGAASADEPMVV
jgi:hypothetical protein